MCEEFSEMFSHFPFTFPRVNRKCNLSTFYFLLWFLCVTKKLKLARTRDVFLPFVFRTRLDWGEKAKKSLKKAWRIFPAWKIFPILSRRWRKEKKNCSRLLDYFVSFSHVRAFFTRILCVSHWKVLAHAQFQPAAGKTRNFRSLHWSLENFPRLLHIKFLPVLPLSLIRHRRVHLDFLWLFIHMERRENRSCRCLGTISCSFYCFQAC